MIPFNRPYFTGEEIDCLASAIHSGHVSGNGPMTKKCHAFFEQRWGFKKCLFTSSCTDALEMCALLLELKDGDEVVVPAYTFVSSALAFTREGAKITFVDSRADRPGIDESAIEAAITSKTKAIVVVHYAGVACDMDVVMSIADRHGITVIEDAAQAVDSYYKGRPLGGIGHLGCFSFHETKNIHCGEGGMLVVNDERFLARAEILWEKGTNRSQFFRGEANKYGWVDTGSSFLASDLSAACLYGQLKCLDAIQGERVKLWDWYYGALAERNLAGLVRLPLIPSDATNNAHNFHLVTKSNALRNELIASLKAAGYHSTFHYLALNHSEYHLHTNKYVECAYAEMYEECLVRLPFYIGIKKEAVQEIAGIIERVVKVSAVSV
jgi:dTDP-4-amino-4,6-dideoxygalactose transaminase